MRNVRLTKNGIECPNSNSTVYLDPKKIKNEGIQLSLSVQIQAQLCT